MAAPPRSPRDDTGRPPVKADFWHERWARNQIGFHQREINVHLQQFWPRLELAAEAPVFAPLCGKSRDLLWLRAQGHPVLGVEISPIAVSDFFGENGLQPAVEPRGPFQRHEVDGLTLLQGDFFALTAEDLNGTQGVYDRASLVALPPDMRPAYVHHLQRILPAQIRILLVTMEYAQEEMRGPPFSVHEEEVRSLYQEWFHVELLSRLDILAENPGFRDRGLSALQEKVFRVFPR